MAKIFLIMKKIFSIVAIATLMFAGMTSCSNDIETASQAAQSRKSSIGFDAKAASSVSTRGFAVNAANAQTSIPNFMTWAYDDNTNGLYMGTSATVGLTVTGDGTGNWTYSPVQFWPVNPLNFVAMAPATPNGLTVSTGCASTDNVVTLTTALTLSTNVEDQDDIMFANADDIEKDDHSNDVPFQFQHALSQIVFKGKFDGEGAVTRATIAEIALGGINKTATLVYNSEGQFYGGAVRPATVSTPAVFSLDATDLEGADWQAATQGTTAFDLTLSNSATKDNAWFLIPQSTEAWDGTSLTAGVPSSGAYIKLRVQLEKDGVVIKGNAEGDAIYLPLTVAWERGKKYIYTIEFNGTNALDPITFSVTAVDWTEVDAYYTWNDINATVNEAQDMSAFLTTAGNFSGITSVDDSHYAIVDDKSVNEGWYPITLNFNADGTIASLVQKSYVTAGSALTNQDNEAIAYCSRRNSFFLTREMSTTINEYTSEGTQTGFALQATNYSGLTSNAGFESLTYNSNADKFFVTTEGSTSGDDAGTVKIAQFSRESLGYEKSWKYPLENALYTPSSGDVYAKGVSDICLLDDGRLLVLEREAWVSKSSFSAFTATKLYVVNPVITNNGSLLEKTLVTSWSTTDNISSIIAQGFKFANYEGMCLGPRLSNGSRLLILLTDSQSRYSIASYSLKDYWRTIQLFGI